LRKRQKPAAKGFLPLSGMNDSCLIVLYQYTVTIIHTDHLAAVFGLKLLTFFFKLIKLVEKSVIVRQNTNSG